jgi:hypothetical protein
MTSSLPPAAIDQHQPTKDWNAADEGHETQEYPGLVMRVEALENDTS